MALRFLGPDPVHVELERVLSDLANGLTPRKVERKLVDCKEEPGRRLPDGTIIPGAARSEAAARYLAGEATCFANTPGGGALVVGFADDGTPIGTDLEAEWLRQRIYELTNRRLGVSVREFIIRDTRVLVLLVPEAPEFIEYGGRIRWRIGTNCVEVDGASWRMAHAARIGFDWSAQPSNHPVAAARPASVDVARRYLRASGEPGAATLAALADADLLSRMNAITGDGFLTNAAALLFVEHAVAPALVYIRRDTPGGDSRIRLPSLTGEREPTVLEELAAVERAIEAYNPTEHVPSGLAVGKLHALPPPTVREALVNGLAHRDWHTDAPTTVEHVGSTLTVTSPGGFVGGVTPDNIITHPSAPRNRALAILLAKLRVAEHEGVGVDRMVRDMLRAGYPRPVIEETGGPMVRTSLVGGLPDTGWMAFLARLGPTDVREDLDAILLLDRLVAAGWADALRAARVLQKSTTEAERALAALDRITDGGRPVVTRVPGTGEDPAWRFSDSVRTELAPRLRRWLPAQARERLVLDWVTERGRVRTSEIADIVGVSIQQAWTVLTRLEEEGRLAPGRANRAGRGFWYVLPPNSLPRSPEDAAQPI